MIDALLKGSLRTRLLVFILAGFIAAAGWYSYKNLTIEAFPDPTDTQVQVITLYPGQATEEVERRVSIPLERALNGVPGLFRLRSVSLFGLSQLTLTFDDGVDPLVARQQITERLPDANLPPGISPDLGPLATPIGEVYRYTLEGTGADPRTLRTIQDWVVRPAIMRVPGVADVVSYGGLQQEVHVEPNPAKMAALGVVLDDIFQALSKASANASGGTIERGAQVFVIRSIGTFKTTDDIGKTRVGFHQDRPVKLSDVANVTLGYAPRQGVITRGTDLDTVEGIVLMRRGENPSVVLAALRERLDELHAHSLPNGVPAWTIEAKGDDATVTLVTPDGTGHGATYSLGAFPGPCVTTEATFTSSGVACKGSRLSGLRVRAIHLRGCHALSLPQLFSFQRSPRRTPCSSSRVTLLARSHVPHTDLDATEHRTGGDRYLRAFRRMTDRIVDEVLEDATHEIGICVQARNFDVPCETNTRRLRTPLEPRQSPRRRCRSNRSCGARVQAVLRRPSRCRATS